MSGTQKEKISKKYICETCGKEYNNPHQYYGHIQFAHNNPSKLRKNKTLEEIYGVDKAIKIKEKHRISMFGKNPMLGRKHTNETKEKISKKAQERWLNPDNHKKQSETMKEYYKEHPEFFEHIREITKGKTVSEEQRQKRSITLKERYRKYPETHPNYRMRKRKMTKIEKYMYKILELSNVKFKFQQPIVCKNGTKYPDFYLPNHKMIVECDGSYWHKDKERDKKRDKEILEVLGEDWKIEHILEPEIYEFAKFFGLEEKA